MGNRQEDILGVNKRLYEWLEKSNISPQIPFESAKIKSMLGIDSAKRGLASREFAKAVWQMYPELGPTPLFDILSKEEYNRSFYDNYRDHTAHQVKVFLLGAFIYEECDVIRNAVDVYLQREIPELKEGELSDAFFAIWTAAALSHDIGYLVESEKADSIADGYWEKIKTEINNILKNPLACTKAIGISAQEENNGIISKVVEIKGFQDLENDELFKILEDFSIQSALVADDKNALCEYYSFAQKQDSVVGREKFRDHGIASSLLLLEIWQSYIKHLEEIQNYETPNRKTRKAVKKAIELFKKKDIYFKEIKIAAGAIALHNLNKKLWVGVDMLHVSLDGFCLEMEGEEALPIAFLLRLTDELQDWDREYFRALQPEDDPLTAKDIDIEVKDNRICISYLSDNRELVHPERYPQGRFVKLKSTLFQYLNKDFLDQILKYDSTKKEEWENDNTWGLKKIHFSRSEAHIDYNQEGFARDSCDIIAFGLRNFRQNIGKMVEESAKRGLKIRILTMQPDSLFVRRREIEEGAPESIRNSIIELLGWVKKIKASLPKEIDCEEAVQVKFYDSLPLDFYCKMDNKLYVGPYLAGKESRDTITYEFEAGDVWELYSMHFEELWNNEVKGINPVDTAYVYHVSTQKEVVDKILEAFCNILVDFDNTKRKIRAIAVKYLPKNGKRKTIFFWNKEEGSQSYPEVERKYGVAGRMDEYKCPYIHRFKKGENGIYYYFSKNGEVQEPNLLQEKGGRKEGLKAILAAPIWDRAQEKIMGLITFEFIREEPIDFNKLDKEIESYLVGESDLDDYVMSVAIDGGGNHKKRMWKWPELRTLYNMLNVAKECAGILAQIIINYMEVDEDKLFVSEEYK